MSYFKRFLKSYFLFAVLILSGTVVFAQDETGPIKIKIRRVVFRGGNQYSVNIPDLAFHVLLQKSFETIQSSITADYDYRRKDMGFGMSHSLTKYIVNPGISVEDKLYFRRVFNDSTGIWSRTQSVTPFLIHKYNENVSLGLAFNFENEWSPNRRMGTDINYYRDNSITGFYYYQSGGDKNWESFIFSLNIERSYKIFKGEYNYLLLDTMAQYLKEVNRYIRYKGQFSFRGNLTPQKSPLFFIGGNSSLIGYENDEFWGRKAFFTQNLFEIMPYPKYSFSIGNAEFRELNVLIQFDIGQVRSSAKIKDLKPQNKDIKTGLGIGFGVNTDLPYMPDTDLYFITASPTDDYSDLKFYAGFGGWLK
ncbi:hypothetical protein ACFL50_01680 [Candidatus Latescibacterota bacterium]